MLVKKTTFTLTHLTIPREKQLLKLKLSQFLILMYPYNTLATLQPLYNASVYLRFISTVLFSVYANI